MEARKSKFERRPGSHLFIREKMKFLSNLLEKLRNKPEKERVRIVFVLSLIVTLILIFLFQKVPFFKSKKEKKREEIKVFEKIKKNLLKKNQKRLSFLTTIP